MTVEATGEQMSRPRGRPRRVIDETDLLDAVERLLREGGLDAVSIERVAGELGVSRATMYRAVPSKELLLSRVFRRMTDRLTNDALAATAADGRSARERLDALIRLHVDAAIAMRDYLFVFFGREWLSPEVYEEWRRWTRRYEQIWVDAVSAATEESALTVREPAIATRLMIGMLMWISRWYRPGMISADELAAEAIRLLGGEAE